MGAVPGRRREEAEVFGVHLRDEDRDAGGAPQVRCVGEDGDPSPGERPLHRAGGARGQRAEHDLHPGPGQRGRRGAAEPPGPQLLRRILRQLPDVPKRMPRGAIVADEDRFLEPGCPGAGGRSADRCSRRRRGPPWGDCAAGEVTVGSLPEAPGRRERRRRRTPPPRPARGTMHGSWRPATTIGPGDPSRRSMLSWGRAMEGVGFTANRTTMGAPVARPPRIPPAWFVRERPGHPGTRRDRCGRSPRIRTERKPAPNSIPFTARDRESEVGDLGFDGIEEGFPEAEGGANGPDLDDAADAVPVLPGRRDGLRHPDRRVGVPLPTSLASRRSSSTAKGSSSGQRSVDLADGGRERRDGDPPGAQQRLGDAPGDDQADGHPSGEDPPSGEVGLGAYRPGARAGRSACPPGREP